MSTNHSSEHEIDKRLEQAILKKDEAEALSLMENILFRDQMALPGFSPKDANRDAVKKVETILKDAAAKLEIPSFVYKTAYARCPDFKKIITAFTNCNPIVELESLAPMMFLPIMPAKAKRFFDPEEVWDTLGDGQWIVEPKWDGWYCQIHHSKERVELFLRSGTKKIISPQIQGDSNTVFGLNDVIVECEIAGQDLEGNIVPRKDMFKPGNSIIARVFDLLYCNKDFTRKPYLERLTELTRFKFSETKWLKLVEWEIVDTKQRFLDCFNHWNDKAELEGVITKRPTMIYVASAQSNDFLKIKVKDSVDAAILGYTEKPRSYLMAVFDEDDEQYVPFSWITIPEGQKDILEGKISEFVDPKLPNITIAGKTTLFRTYPGLVVEVDGDKLQSTDLYPCGVKQTGKGWSLFQARIVQIRTDKGPDDVNTVSDFLALSKMAGY